MLKRALTAAVAIPLVVFIIKGLDETAFFIFVFLVVAMAIWEYSSMAFPDEGALDRGLGMFLGCLVLLAAFGGLRFSAGNDLFPCFISAGACLLSFFGLFFYYIIFNRTKTNVFNKIVLKFFGIFYIALLFSYVLLLRACSDGVSLLFFILLVTWAGDTGAYIIGRWKGKTPLCPEVSPKKTIEGAWGGFFSGILASLLCRMLFLKEMSIFDCVVLGVGINFMNQVGDLSESLIKRAFSTKDSGSLLPGHGGILDRIDSLLFAAPFLFYYVQLVMT
jgi:phosphatidate cytidylyltransferase